MSANREPNLRGVDSILPFEEKSEWTDDCFPNVESKQENESLVSSDMDCPIESPAPVLIHPLSLPPFPLDIQSSSTPNAPSGTAVSLHPAAKNTSKFFQSPRPDKSTDDMESEDDQEYPVHKQLLLKIFTTRLEPRPQIVTSADVDEVMVIAERRANHEAQIAAMSPVAREAQQREGSSGSIDSYSYGTCRNVVDNKNEVRKNRR